MNQCATFILRFRKHMRNSVGDKLESYNIFLDRKGLNTLNTAMHQLTKTSYEKYVQEWRNPEFLFAESRIRTLVREQEMFLVELGSKEGQCYFCPRRNVNPPLVKPFHWGPGELETFPVP